MSSESSNDHSILDDGLEENASFADSSATGKNTGSDKSEEHLVIAKKETTAIFAQRLLVFAVMSCAAVTISLIVHRMTSRAEATEFKTQFAGAAKLLIGSFRDIVEVKFGALTALSVAITAHGIDHATQRWPFVTLSSFQQRADTALSNSGALYVHINPLVEGKEQRAEWEDFVVNNPDAQWM